MYLRFLSIFYLAICVLSSGVWANDDTPSSAAFQILKRNCFECHGHLKQEGDLRLDLPSEASLQSLFDAQHPDESLLLERVSHPQGHPDRMPPVGPGLTAQEIEILKLWIKAGPSWPDQSSTLSHWAYIAPQSTAVPTPPVTHSAWTNSPIDLFVLEKLTEQRLQPAPREKPERLLRRLYFDLIGLPPPPDVAEKFSNQPTDEEYSRIVDSLLSQPTFGERWARHWLDAAHYADSHGFQRDDLRDIWPYRDWVIEALNDDMPYDQYTIEQLAGDLLPNATEKQRIATGFLRCAPTNVEAGSLPEETRIEQVFDRVNTVGTVWLGTTFECCQCHDHKYDPFSAKDYYRVFACFNNTESEAGLEDDKVPSSIKFRGPYLEIADTERTRTIENLKSQLASIHHKLLERRRLLIETHESWYASLAARAVQVSEVHTLKILQFESLGTTDEHEILDDGSVLLTGGDPPDVDTYEIVVSGTTLPMSALRIAALKHPNLPGGGPGRGDPVRTNFVLNEVTAEVIQSSPETNTPQDLPIQKLKFQSASANYSQAKFPVSDAIDGKPKTGWAIGPQFDRDHHAVFQFSQPIQLTTRQALRVRLTQNFGNGRTMGRVRLSAIIGDASATPIPPEIRSQLSQPFGELAEQAQSKVLDFYQLTDAPSIALKKTIANLENKISQLKPVQTLVVKELSEPRQSFVFLRGDYQQLGEEIKPDLPELFKVPEHSETTQGFNRLQLARWLASRQNPLSSRAAVNRYWGELFGNGLVTTPEDFGIKGAPPTHPKLLDWLVLYFEDHDYSLKKLVRAIVLSETYRQSSDTSEAQLQADPENTWLARGPRFRMDAEMVRDNILAVSGTLSLKQKGPPIYPQQPDGLWTKIGGQVYNYETSPLSDANRRSGYVVWKRASPYPSLINFDSTSRLVCSVKRNRTNTPLQALTLLNDPIYVNAAKQFSQRILREKASGSWDEKLNHAYRTCLSRLPTPTERQRLQELYDSIQADAPLTQSASEKEMRAWFEIATVLLNLHETITKE